MANSKLTGLTATTTPVSTDIFYIITDPGGTPTSQKVTGANMGKALTLVGKVTITQPASSATLTIPDGLTLNAGPGGTLTALAFTTPGANVATFLATPSSANLAAAVTDESGTTGALLFSIAPSIVDSLTILHNSSDIVAPILNLQKARGTGTTIIVTGDALGEIDFKGYDGANQLLMGQIKVASTGTIAAGRVPTTMSFSTATDVATSILTRAIFIDKAQNVGIGDAPPVFAGFISLSVGSTAKIGLLKWIGTYNGGDGSEYYQDSSGHFRFNINSSIAGMVLTATGQLNIGSSTSPGARLLITDIANEIALKSTGYSITGSGTTSMVDLAGTLNGTGIVDVIKSSITKTATDAASTHINFKTDGSSVFSVGILGAVAAAVSVDTPLYKAGGTSGVATFGPSVVTSITVKGGIITAIS